MDDATTPPLRSGRGISSADRLILALDVPSGSEARALVEHLGDAVTFYKLGLELFMAGGYFELVEWLRARGKKVFVDLKLFDVPETVASAVRQLRGRCAVFTTVHGNDSILEAACREKGDLGILAVTVLTSLDRHDIAALGFHTDVESLVLSRAERAVALGCDGVIASGRETRLLRERLGDRLLIVVPGIRPVENVERVDDQKRTVDLEEAFAAGADYIVVGRPIRRAADPRAAAKDYQRRIERVFASADRAP